MTQKACLASVLISLDWIHQLGVPVSQSVDFKAVHVTVEQAEHMSCTATKCFNLTTWRARN